MHPLCASLTACLTDSDCWRQIDLANITDLPTCALSCYEQSNVTSLNDIAAAAAPCSSARGLTRVARFRASVSVHPLAPSRTQLKTPACEYFGG